MQITVYTKDNCMQCLMTTRRFQQYHVPVTLDDITTEKNLDLASRLNHQQAPMVIVTDTDGDTVAHWSGFNPEKIQTYSRAYLDAQINADE